MSDFLLAATPPLAGLSLEKAGVTIRPVGAVFWAALTNATTGLGERLGLTLPDRPGAAFGAGTTLLWNGTGRFTLIADGGLDAATLADKVSDAAIVTDLTGSQFAVEIAGPAAPVLLSRIVPIDLHPSMFSPGSAAATVSGHLGVTLWQVDATPRYRIACYRSFAESLWHALETASAA